MLGIVAFIALAGFPDCRKKANRPASFNSASHRRCFLLDDRRRSSRADTRAATRFRARKIARSGSKEQRAGNFSRETTTR